ncbi:hypothetical protein SAMN05216360_12354 [Methylobacterium phyllostachyos]|uniref:Uncharacterized protein n=1 Tax=Methylobacterium phyllostachyos TaxID=582672 RepID=A0A1H0JRE3_9HYPH|nr:hypothetical protein [Methylobacterium phyllostachyos]SDO45981.1 hypothetical protein SAMN05216360_12354 [Methylobacterium phyllostachyos]
MPLDPKRLVRDAKKAQTARPATLIGRETTGVTRAVRAALPTIRKLRAAGVSWAAIAQAMAEQGVRQKGDVPLTATRLTAIVGQVEVQDRRRDASAAPRNRPDLATSDPTSVARPELTSKPPRGPAPSDPAGHPTAEAIRRAGLAELNRILKKV